MTKHSMPSFGTIQFLILSATDMFQAISQKYYVQRPFATSVSSFIATHFFMTKFDSEAFL